MATETADEALQRVIMRVLNGHRARGLIQKAIDDHRRGANMTPDQEERAHEYLRRNHEALQRYSAGEAWEKAEAYATGRPERYAKELATGQPPRRFGDPIVTAGGRKTSVQSDGGTVENEYVAPVSDYEARGLLAAAARGRGAWADTILSAVQATLSDQSIARMCDSELGAYCERLETKTRTAALQASKSYSPWAVSVVNAAQGAMNEDPSLARQARRAAD
jgi:hypothetical protein